MSVDKDEVDNLCREFLENDSFKGTCETFKEICDILNIDLQNTDGFYERAREALLPYSSFKKGIWRLLDARAAHEEYMNGEIGKGKTILVVGAGPCGLRMAIEGALLGAKVVVIEMRDYISRNNVLHLWPFVIQDMKSIGAKEFYPQFANGSLNHVSIRRMQLMLLKVALLLGVEIHAPVRFIDLVEPTGSHGWKVAVSPTDSIVNDFEVDVVIGANGAKNILKGFRRKNPFRAKLAIAITANFVNRQTREDVAVEEIPGIFCFMNPEFFGDLKSRGFDLENFVYYQNETHYFVLTVKKGSLLKRGVLKQDYPDPDSLLAPDNIDKSELRIFSREIAEVATANQIPNYEYAQTHREEDDVAVFDFTVMYQAENSVLAREVNGKKLLTSIIGDSLINPFWPRGTGCAHGFLGVFDTTWLIREWFEGSRPDIEVLCEREKLYSLLSQTSPNNLNKSHKKYTIDPKTRYSALILPTARQPENPDDLFLRGRQTPDDVPIMKPELPKKPTFPAKRPAKKPSLETVELLNWYQEKLVDFQDVAPVADLTDSWRNGLAFCALLSVYRPEQMDVTKLEPSKVFKNTSVALEMIEEEFGVAPILSPADLASRRPLDRLAMISYLVCLQQELKQHDPHTSNKGTGDNTGTNIKDLKTAMASAKFVAKLLKYMRSQKVKERAKGKLGKAVRKIQMMRAFAVKSRPSPRLSVADMIKKLSGQQVRDEEQLGQDTDPSADADDSSLVRDPAGEPDPDHSADTEDTTDSALLSDPDEEPSQPQAITGESSYHDTSELEAGGAGLVRDRLKFFGDQDKRTSRLLSSDTCCICDRSLYITDRYSDHGYFFHRQCFKCHVCHVRLYVGSSNVTVLRDDEGNAHFYCFNHGYQAADTGSPDDGDTGDEVAGQSDEVTDDVKDTTEPQSEADGSPEYQSTASNRLFLGDVIQRGLEEVEEEEGELEERGMEVERSIRGIEEEALEEPSGRELMNQWLEVLQRKKELAEKESKLMIQGMLLELEAARGTSSQIISADETKDVDTDDGPTFDEDEDLLEQLVQITRL